MNPNQPQAPRPSLELHANIPLPDGSGQVMNMPLSQLRELKVTIDAIIGSADAAIDAENDADQAARLSDPDRANAETGVIDPDPHLEDYAE